MIITITGDLGSGKSSVAKILAKKMNFEYISTGFLYRKIAEEYNVDALELNKISVNDHSIDDRIDNYLKSLNNTDKNIIIDSRLAWHFVTNSIRLFFEVNPEVAAERVLNDKNRLNEPAYNDKKSAYQALNERKTTENNRYRLRYGIDCDDISNFDLVINTSFVTPEQICEQVIRILDLIKQNQDVAKYWISPKLLYPSENIRLIAREETKEIKASIKENGYIDNSLIECVKYDSKYFIWDGHKRSSSAIYCDIPFVPVLVLASDEEEIHKGHTVKRFVKAAYNLSNYYDWEDAHQFRFTTYPIATIDSK